MPNTALTIQHVANFIRSNNHELISKEYKNNRSRIDVKCNKCDRVWNTTYLNLYNGCWCKYCYNNRFLKVKTFIEDNDHLLLSSEYKNKYSRLDIKCNKCNYVWNTTYDALYKGYWCKFCSIKQKTKKKSIKDAKKIAEDRGGKCLSIKYDNAHSNLIWKCKYGHVWENSYGSINSGKWCPKCSTGMYERICREFLEGIFGFEFIKIRPNWLKNKKGNNLELDGYCKDLNIAFEHNGSHHYEDLKYFHRRQSYDEVSRADKIKVSRCKELGIKLIIIPELEKYVKISELKNHIEKEFLRLNIKKPSKFDSFKISDLNIYSSEIDNLKKIAKNKGLELVSNSYIGYNVKLLWKCKCNYNWYAIPSKIKNNILCLKCGAK